MPSADVAVGVLARLGRELWASSLNLPLVDNNAGKRSVAFPEIAGGPRRDRRRADLGAWSWSSTSACGPGTNATFSSILPTSAA